MPHLLTRLEEKVLRAIHNDMNAERGMPRPPQAREHDDGSDEDAYEDALSVVPPSPRLGGSDEGFADALPERVLPPTPPPHAELPARSLGESGAEALDPLDRKAYENLSDSSGEETEKEYDRKVEDRVNSMMKEAKLRAEQKKRRKAERKKMEDKQEQEEYMTPEDYAWLDATERSLNRKRRNANLPSAKPVSEDIKNGGEESMADRHNITTYAARYGNVQWGLHTLAHEQAWKPPPQPTRDVAQIQRYLDEDVMTRMLPMAGSGHQAQRILPDRSGTDRAMDAWLCKRVRQREERLVATMEEVVAGAGHGAAWIEESPAGTRTVFTAAGQGVEVNWRRTSFDAEEGVK